MSVGDWILKRSGRRQEKAEPTLVQSTHEIIKQELSLKKAIEDRDWAKIWLNHDPKQKDLIDHTYHHVNSNAPKEYHNMFYGADSTHSSVAEKEKGISPKVIHKIKDDHYMTKPYLTQRELPLSGWGIMTTHNLFNASGLGDLVEDVNTHILEKAPYVGKVPVTVHKFAKDYTNVADLPRNVSMYDINEPKTPSSFMSDTQNISNKSGEPWTPKKVMSDEEISKKYKNAHNVNPLHARQIGVMDFLTGNSDRHGNNLLVSNKPKNGFKSLLAIDHDRSFSYSQEDFNSPHDSYEISTMARLLGDHAGHKSDEHDQKLASWWDSNKINILDEMNRNLDSIKDHGLRKYVRRNFDQRFQLISEWADSYGKEKRSFFQQNVSSVIRPFPLNHVDDDSLKVLADSLPKDKTQALGMLMDHMRKPKDEINDKELFAVQKVASDTLLQMPDEDVIKFFSKTDHDPKVVSFKHDVLMEMKRDPSAHFNKIKKLLDVNAELPKDLKFMNDFWDLHLRHILAVNDRSMVGVA